MYFDLTDFYHYVYCKKERNQLNLGPDCEPDCFIKSDFAAPGSVFTNDRVTEAPWLIKNYIKSIQFEFELSSFN